MLRTFACYSLLLITNTLPDIFSAPQKKLTFVRALNTFNKKLALLEKQYSPLPMEEKQRLQQKAFEFLWGHAHTKFHTIPTTIHKKVLTDLRGYFVHQFPPTPSHQKKRYKNRMA